MKNVVLEIVGWFVLVQGVLGAGGLLFGDGPWGVVHQYWDLSVAAYLVLLAVGIALVAVVEKGKAARRKG
ncbi:MULTISPECIES: hypothetical protein [Streptomyces]|uniref:Uncharacterized protein n=1 Tax=Streptomyces tsukubensis (strain DSM 42081 / NBRC 108919 / NRRL 18488 / 9993) TaxID=1114943 RepID=I2N3U8_STRT9|nr:MULTISPECIES: hypothetical protein [Streptomyces]AZK95790.1 hypothetical protein B7R87_19445 [Streptomyces tsukubensis]EIF91695.1 hypothetical protein [Streptomyces tsukubensis NRRL18488]MYS65640.1 hypothetical protein [Streptomyces sp. SID5473]QKM68185.1 hypothetical protein STSU_014345 [Streptomyces tsukubensis NRRL18488]TAI44584.1 hypothetical protein EWI31_14125 [Streptomyces tsukubensis]